MTDTPPGQGGEPTVGHLGLPADTITQEAQSVQLVFTPGSPGKLVPTLIVETTDLGVYELHMSVEVYAALAHQLHKAASLTAAELTDLVGQLHQASEEEDE